MSAWEAYVDKATPAPVKRKEARKARALEKKEQEQATLWKQ